MFTRVACSNMLQYVPTIVLTHFNEFTSTKHWIAMRINLVSFARNFDKVREKDGKRKKFRWQR